MIALLGMALWAQPPALDSETVLARCRSGIRVTRGEYLEHLWTVYGRSRLEELLLDRAMQRELRNRDLSGIDPAVRAGLADPEARAAAALAATVQRDHGGDAKSYEAFLARTGRTREEAMRALRLEVLREDRITALVQLRRRADRKALRRVFDSAYGVDGLRVRVRHVFVSFQRVRRELESRAGGRNVNEAAVDAAARAHAEKLLRAHRGGASFTELVARGTDDPLARQLARDPARREEAGLIPGYNFQAFGTPFADAVRSMRPGEVKGPVRTSHGYHLIQLVSAVRTRFEDVQDELRRRLRLEPPTLAERRRLREWLIARHGIDEALRG